MSNFELDGDKHSTAEKVKYFFYEHILAFSLAVSRLSRVRYQTIASIFLIAFAMSLSLIFAFALKNSYQLSSSLSQSSTMTIYPTSSVERQQIESLKQSLLQYDVVDTITLISPEQIALEVFQNELPEYMRQSLPTLLSVTLTDLPSKNNTQMDSYLYDLKQKIQAHPNVNQVDLDLVWHSQLKSMLHLGQMVSWGIGLVLLFTVIIVTNYTIRMMLEKYRDEISIYHDLGATHTFIQRPYLYQGLLLAFAGALLTLCLLTAGYFSLSQDLSKIEELFQCSLRLDTSDFYFMGKFLLGVIFFAWICSLTSIKKWLHLFDLSQQQQPSQAS